MKAIIWKELRELASRSVALLLLLALTPVVIALYSSGIEIQGEVRVLTREVPYSLLFVSALAACALGFLQTLFDNRRDQWAFLIHRAESATRIFLGKAIAAGLIYAVITLTPVLVCAVWGMRGGVERFPFSWYLLVPMVAAIVAAIPFYFATLLAMRWQALWRANYLLPISFPFLSVAVFLIVIQSSEFVRLQILCGWLLTSGIVGVAAWGAFVRSGEASGRPFPATICLGISAYLTIFLGLGLMIVAGEMAYVHLLSSDELDSLFPREFTSMVIDERGHVIAATQDRKNHTIRDIKDLDDPESTRYRSMIGNSVQYLDTTFRGAYERIKYLRAAKQRIDWNPLLMTRFRVSNDNWWNLVFNSARQQHVLDEIGLLNARVSIRWIFSSADGLLYGYEQRYKTDEVVPRPEPPRLISIVGPDGFAEPGKVPQRRFSRLLLNANSVDARRHLSIWPDATSKGALVGPGYYLVCEDGLYCVNIGTRKVYQILASPAGKKIRYLTSLGPDFVVVYNDSVAVHEGTQDPIPGGQAAVNPSNLLLPGKLKYMAAIPREILHDFEISFGKLENRPELIFAGSGSTNRPYRVVKTQMDGTVISSRPYAEPPQPASGLTLRSVETAVMLPPGVLVLGSLVDAAISMSNGQGPGTLAWSWQRSAGSMIYFSVVMAASTAVCLWLVSRTARRYGFSLKTRRIWHAVVVMLGPLGLLTLWFLRDWPAMEVCEACRKKRPVDQEICPHCKVHAPAPPDSGREIQTADRGVPQVA